MPDPGAELPPPRRCRTASRRLRMASRYCPMSPVVLSRGRFGSRWLSALLRLFPALPGALLRLLSGPSCRRLRFGSRWLPVAFRFASALPGSPGSPSPAAFRSFLSAPPVWLPVAPGGFPVRSGSPRLLPGSSPMLSFRAPSSSENGRPFRRNPCAKIVYSHAVCQEVTRR